jgi:hypothetical protein
MLRAPAVVQYSVGSALMAGFSRESIDNRHRYVTPSHSFR